MTTYENRLLALDLSTACTGYAFFDIRDGKLLSFGKLKATSRGMSKLPPLLKRLTRLERMARQIDELTDDQTAGFIVIEEVTGGRNRHSQKTLDGLHWAVLQHLRNHLSLDLIFFQDITGKGGWRTKLKLRLTDEDKKINRKNRKINKERAPRTKKLPVIGPKHLAVRFVNKQFGLNLDYDLRKTDGDIADAICVGFAYLKKD